MFLIIFIIFMIFLLMYMIYADWQTVAYSDCVSRNMDNV